MSTLRPLFLALPLLAVVVGGSSCGQHQPAAGVERVQVAEQQAERPLDFRHPLGLGFDLPDGWRADEVPQGLRLLPRGPARGPQGDAELYMIGMIGADPSVRSLDDRRAPGLVAQLVRGQLPFLRAVGAAQRVEGRDDLRVFHFAGRSPLGMQIECRVHGLLTAGWFVALTAVAEPAQLERREPALDRVLARLELDAPQADATLTGTWYSTARSSAGGIRDRLNVASTTTSRLTVDGLLWSGTQSSVVGVGRQGGSITAVTDESRAAGRWARVGDQLYVVWKSGGAGRYTLHLQGQPGRRELLLTPPAGGGNKLLWTEYRL